MTGEQKFIREIPKDPWGNPYVYTRDPPGGQPYLIISYGADGKPGGIDAAADLRSDDWISY
jgi:general secretion pathway protein G